MEKDEIIFIKKLANLMQKHGIYIASRKNGKYTKVIFQNRDHQDLNINSERCHYSAFNLRVCGLNMTAKKANKKAKK
tara:strand:- start:129 stop:359 length:231 start_codon:yes stop_codon:yes gene_type:complete